MTMSVAFGWYLMSRRMARPRWRADASSSWSSWAAFTCQLDRDTPGSSTSTSSYPSQPPPPPVQQLPASYPLHHLMEGRAGRTHLAATAYSNSRPVLLASPPHNSYHCPDSQSWSRKSQLANTGYCCYQNGGSARVSIRGRRNMD